VVRHPRAASGDRINAKPWSACGGGSDRWDVAETEFLQSSEQAPPNQTRVSEPGDNALFANHHLPIRFTGKIMLLSTNTGAQAWHETTEKGLLLTVFLAELSRSW